jgi:outer membrane immunogenic protein
MRGISLVSVSVVASLVAFSSNTFAADLPPQPTVKAPAMVPVETFSWTGVYVGAHAGGGWSKLSGTDAFDGTTTGTSLNGWLAGGQIGANYQVGQWVFGVQGDYAYADVKKTQSLAPIVGTLVMKHDYFATASGRIGYAFDRLLIYGKGGGAWTRDKWRATDNLGGLVVGSFNRSGWMGGAGLEWAFSGNWSVFAEYNYLSFGKINEALTTSGSGTLVATGSGTVKDTTHIAKAGINFRF